MRDARPSRVKEPQSVLASAGTAESARHMRTRSTASPGQTRGKTVASWSLATACLCAAVAATVLVLAPLWHLLVLALEPASHAEQAAWRFPVSPGWENFRQLIGGTDFLLWTVNSLVVSSAVAAIGVLLAATAGYALSRFRFFGRLAVMQTVLITQIFPVTMLLLPVFLVFTQAKLIGSLPGLILVYLATVLPFGIWQMKNFYDALPESVEESAAMDGCTPGEIFRKVVLPVSAPGLAVTGLFCFAAAWNEYVIAAVLLPGNALVTLPLGLRHLHAAADVGQPSLFAAGALIVALPMLALYLVLSRFLTARIPDITIRH